MAEIRKLASFAIVAVLGVCSALPATTLMRMSVGDLTRAAHVIVRARCVANSTRRDSGEIWTFTTLNVDEVWKGSAPDQITVRLLGGEFGNLKSSVSGVPRFEPGEELVLFLERTRTGDFSVVSWVQGTFRIRNDLGTEGEFVTQDTAGFAVFDPVSHRFNASGIRNMRSDAFHALVAASVEAERGSK